MLRQLPNSEKAQIDEKIRELFNCYNKDMVFAGLKVRKLAGKDDYFEIDTSANRRILIRKQKGFIELIASSLPMEYALDLNRLIELQMIGAVG